MHSFSEIKMFIVMKKSLKIILQKYKIHVILDLVFTILESLKKIKFVDRLILVTY